MGRHERALMALGGEPGIEQRARGDDQAGDDEPEALVAPMRPQERVAPPQDQVEGEDRERDEKQERFFEERSKHRSGALVRITSARAPPASRLIEPDVEIAK